MGQIFRFLQALTRLASKGDIKIDDAYKFAKQEFGEVSDLLKLQINKIFKQSKAPSIKKPEKKPGEVIEASFKPGADKRGNIVEESPSQASGIMKTNEASPLMKNIDDVKQNIKGMSENNPKTFRMPEEERAALGYPNRMIEGIIRTAAREILSKKGIDVSKADPIDTFADIFGVNSLERLEDISDELLSAQDYKQLNSILQKNELYNVTPKSGLDLKQSDEIEELTEFDPTDRKPNAMGGINRIGYADGPDDPKKLIKKIPKVGKVVSGVESLINLVNKKFGKGAVKTADEIDRPKNVKAFDDFETRNPDPKRQMTDEEFEDFAQEFGELDAYDFDGTIGDANRIRKEVKNYQNEMYQQYKMGKLDPEPGDKSPARKQFLQQKFDEMEGSGDPQLMTRDEIEELTFFDTGTEMDEAAKKAIDNASINDEIKRGVADVLSDTSPAGLAKSIEIDNLMLEYPGLSRDFADQIASASPIMKADMIAMVEQSFKMDQMGMSGDEIIDTFKKGTDRTKQANGGLSYLMGM